MKALILDIDDTLYDLSWPLRMAYRSLFSEKDDQYLTELFKAFRKYSDQVFEQSQNGEITMEEMYCYRAQNAFKEMGEPISREKALEFQKLYEYYQDKIKIDPHLYKVLKDLKNTWKLALLSNGSGDHQLKKIRLLRLDDIIPEENIFISGNLGCAKPDPEIFKIAAQKLGLSPEECYYLGDTYENDIIGSSRAGMVPIWFNRRNYKQKDAETFTEAIVTSENELVNFLEELSKKRTTKS